MTGFWRLFTVLFVLRKPYFKWLPYKRSLVIHTYLDQLGERADHQLAHHERGVPAVLGEDLDQVFRDDAARLHYVLHDLECVALDKFLKFRDRES